MEEFVSKYVWYVGYGSNLSKQRFLCYIVGGIPKYGKKYNDGCSNTECPIDDKPFRIPYRLYFALPGGETKTYNWGQGGVAFINPKKEGSEDNWSWCRMWKITCEQYEEVRVQERKPWYNHEIFLGEKNGIPIRTITNIEILSNIIPPSEAYLKTIALGLKETYNFTDNEIAAYLIGKEGIKGKFTKDKLTDICKSATSSNNRLKH
jgi:hypothetical protein